MREGQRTRLHSHDHDAWVVMPSAEAAGTDDDPLDADVGRTFGLELDPVAVPLGPPLILTKGVVDYDPGWASGAGCRVADCPSGDYRAGSVDPLLAAQALAMLALVLATYRYARLVRRRRLARRELREREDAGLRGLVRVIGADQERREARQRDQ